jgi:nitrogen fixation NifU-like protein
MSLNYTKKTLDHFRNPKNIGELKNADATATIGNMICGDQLSFSIKVKDNVIKDIKFLSFGCASNIATASVMTEIVKGMTLDKAKKFDWNKIVFKLGGLPKQKIHCSVLAVEGLKKVIAEYEAKQKKIEVVKNKKKIKNKLK